MNTLYKFIAFLKHFALVLTSIFCMFMNNSYFWVDYFYGDGLYAIVIILFLIYICSILGSYCRARTLGEDFEEVKDLIRGTVVTDLKDLFDSYKHF